MKTVYSNSAWIARSICKLSMLGRSIQLSVSLGRS